jgi:hypothetical protein
MFFGDQYGWMAGYCGHLGIERMEMAVQGGGRMERFLMPIMEKVRRGNFWTYRVSPRAKGPLAVLFRPYEQPIIDVTKAQMLEFSKKAGWQKYMVHTWFCHHPAWDGRPCGACLTCRIAVRQSMAWRIPFHRRWSGAVDAALRPKLRPWLKPVWDMLKGWAGYP